MTLKGYILEAMVAVALVLSGVGCRIGKTPPLFQEKPEVLMSHERLVRATYMSDLVCGKSSWSPDGKMIIFSKEVPPEGVRETKRQEESLDIMADIGIWTLDTMTLEQRHELRNFGAIGNVHFMPDGKSCMYQWGAGHIAVTRLFPKKEDFDVLRSASIVFGSASPSPDGNSVAYFARTRQLAGDSAAGLLRIELVELGRDFQAGKRHILFQPRDKNFTIWPGGGLCFSPSGRDLYFVGSSASGSLDIYRIPILGEGIYRVTDLHAMENINIMGITISPDGQWLACTLFMFHGGNLQPSQSGIWLLKSDGSALHMLVRGAAFPSWAQDGKRMSFAHGKDLWICTLHQDSIPQEGTLISPPKEISRSRAMLSDALRAASDGEFARAIQLCEGMENNPEFGELAGRVLYLQAQCYMAMGKIDDARERYDRLLERYRYTEEAVYSLRHLDLLLSDMGEVFRFGERIDSLMSECARREAETRVRSDAARYAYLQALGWDMEVRGDIEKAYKGYLATMKKYPGERYAWKAGLRAAGCEITMGRRKDAIRSLEWVERRAGISEEGVEALTQLLKIRIQEKDLKASRRIWRSLREKYHPLQDWGVYSVTHHTLIGLASLAQNQGNTVLAREILNFCSAYPPIDLGHRALGERNLLIQQILMHSPETKKSGSKSGRMSAVSSSKKGGNWTFERQKRLKGRNRRS